MNRRATAGELSASIAHEIKQPLGAIMANGNAALRWLGKATPDLGEARAALERIVDATRRASDVIDTIRSMFRKRDGQRFALDVNVAIGVLALLSRDFQRRRIFVETRLRAGLPEIVANGVQLQQVILNLLVNAAEAMDSTTDRDRVLRVTSDQQDHPSGILITVEDSGPGVESKNIERMFEPFYTTKPEGMGMRLAICRSIIEAHGGRLSAAAGRLGGLAMQISLPASATGAAQKVRARVADVVSA
jgi:C4-dicarboxylate-specific signal transduction histidine kinase